MGRRARETVRRSEAHLVHEDRGPRPSFRRPFWGVPITTALALWTSQTRGGP